MVRRGVAHALTALGLAAVVAPLACGSLGTEDPMPSPPPPTNAAVPPGPPAVVVQNEGDAPVSIGIREQDDLSLDRDVFEGSVKLPIGPAPFIAETMELIAPHGARSLMTAKVRVMDDRTNLVRVMHGGILRLEGSPPVLAIGDGKVLVRWKFGKPTLEAEDPRAVIMLPVDVDVPTCVEGAMGTRVEALPASWDPLRTTATISEASTDHGCRYFHFVDPRTSTEAEVAACLPDDAFPFAADDTLAIGPPTDPNLGAGVRIENGRGGAVELLHVALSRTARELAPLGLAMAYDLDPTCVAIHEHCGDVRIPATTTITLGGVTTQKPVFGAAIADPTDARRSVYVLGAYARPINISSCPLRAYDDLIYPAEAFVAIVTRL
jgi:hypothetical protein